MTHLLLVLDTRRHEAAARGYSMVSIWRISVGMAFDPLELKDGYWLSAVYRHINTPCPYSYRDSSYHEHIIAKFASDGETLGPSQSHQYAQPSRPLLLTRTDRLCYLHRPKLCAQLPRPEIDFSGRQALHPLVASLGRLSSSSHGNFHKLPSPTPKRSPDRQESSELSSQN